MKDPGSGREDGASLADCLHLLRAYPADTDQPPPLMLPAPGSAAPAFAGPDGLGVFDEGAEDDGGGGDTEGGGGDDDDGGGDAEGGGGDDEDEIAATGGGKLILAGGIEDKHSTDVESTNRVRATV